MNTKENKVNYQPLLIFGGAFSLFFAFWVYLIASKNPFIKSFDTVVYNAIRNNNPVERAAGLLLDPAGQYLDDHSLYRGPGSFPGLPAKLYPRSFCQLNHDRGKRLQLNYQKYHPAPEAPDGQGGSRRWLLLPVRPLGRFHDPGPGLDRLDRRLGEKEASQDLVDRLLRLLHPVDWIYQNVLARPLAKRRLRGLVRGPGLQFIG